MSKRGYKSIEKFRRKRNRERFNRRERERPNAFSHKKSYTHEEEMMILEHSIPDVDLAKMLGRTTQSIQIKRAKIKKVLKCKNKDTEMLGTQFTI